ncbi:MAG: baseplate protein [Calditrichaeota bacterium]|nr:MAG: baseplate protein [Calditrichota bacterium]
MAEQDFLGVGWKFPLQPNPSGGIARSRHEQKIKESIMIILGTARGERLMRPTFGCDLHSLVFEPNNRATANLAAHYVEEALTLHEPRIQVQKVEVENDLATNSLLIKIAYRIRATNSPQNLVYPFYLNE